MQTARALNADKGEKFDERFGGAGYMVFLHENMIPSYSNSLEDQRNMYESIFRWIYQLDDVVPLLPWRVRVNQCYDVEEGYIKQVSTKG